jgi:hypothetical protein
VRFHSDYSAANCPGDTRPEPGAPGYLDVCVADVSPEGDGSQVVWAEGVPSAFAGPLIAAARRLQSRRFTPARGMVFYRYIRAAFGLSTDKYTVRELWDS